MGELKMPELNVGYEIDIAKKLFNSRLVAKAISQLSFELREIDKTFPADYYDFNNAEKMLELYHLIEDRILVLSEDIKKSRN